jgi:predicted transcriptional regulator
VTFHLPIELRDRIKVTAQAKQVTMLEIATAALEQYLERNPVSEADLRRLLGL